MGSEKARAQPDTVFEMGQRVGVWTAGDCERFMCDGTVVGIHMPDPPNGEEFYDIQTEQFGTFDRISEMRLTDA